MSLNLSNRASRLFLNQRRGSIKLNVRYFGAFVVFYMVLFLPGIKGIGGYWDWSFPYYNEHLGQVFNAQSSSWLLRSNGTTLSYSPDFYLRLMFSFFKHLSVQPELLLYGFLVLTFAIGSYAAWRLATSYDINKLLAVLIALVIFINPLMLYKLLAGHINYYPSLTLLILVALFVRTRGVASPKSGLLLGLLLAFVGLQIQFFLLAALLLAAYLIFNRGFVKLRYIMLALVTALIINMPWLSNFIVGASNASEVSQRAQQISLSASGLSDFQTQFQLSFSSSTHISKIYPTVLLAMFMVLWVAFLIPFITQRQKTRHQVMWLVLALTTMVLATGFYLRFPMGPLSFIAPMFREVGHFGPVLILFLMMGLAASLSNFSVRLKWLLICMLSIFLGSNVFFYIKYLPTLNYSSIRKQFAQFEEFSAVHNRPYESRILTYPFFGQYSFNSVESRSKGSFLLSNVGYDNYLKYSGLNYLENAQQAIDVKNSPQYKLLKTYDLEVLRDYNVRYLYDFSEIYESNYDKYVQRYVYDNDISLIKNNPNFFAQLIKRNPGKLKKVSDHIYEVVDYTPIVSASRGLVKIDKNRQSEQDRPFTSNVYGKGVAFTTEDIPGIGVPLVASVFDKSIKDLPATTVAERFKPYLPSSQGSPTLYVNIEKPVFGYRYTDGVITLYRLTPQSLATKTSAGNEIPAEVAKIDASRDKQYYIDFEGQVMPLHVSNEIRPLWLVESSGEFHVYAGSSNTDVLQNGNFEAGLWEKQVGDCNAYDKNPKLGMRLVNDRTGRAVELSASRHSACTSSAFNLEPTAKYIFSIDYRSDQAQFAEFFMRFGQSDQNGLSRKLPVNTGQWHSYQELIEASGDRKGRIYIYSREPVNAVSSKTVYDNLSLIKVSEVFAGRIEHGLSSYVRQETLAGDLSNLARSENLIANGDFVKGLWSKKADACPGWSRVNGVMDIVPRGGYAGSNALMLKATGVPICASTQVNIQPGKTYSLSFNYLTDHRAIAAITIKYDDKLNTRQSQSLSDAEGKWRGADIGFIAPPGAKTATIQFQSTGISSKGVLYSDVYARQSGKTKDLSYVITMPSRASSEQRLSGSTTGISESTNVTRKFRLESTEDFALVTLGETFNKHWRLATKSGIDAGEITHFRVNGYANGWLINLAQLCSGKLGKECSVHENNRRSVELVARFEPENAFTTSFIASVSTLVAVAIIGYVLPYSKRRTDFSRSIRRLKR